MKKNCKLFLFSVLLMPLLAGCAEENAITIKVLNCEDYIGKEITYDGVDYKTVLAGFEGYERKLLGRPVHVVYDTYDTNETMLSSLRTGKSSYDLICASDYAIQKMMTMGYLQKIDRSAIPNYFQYGSPTLINVMENIYADVDGNPEKLSDYSIGYMWGTLGLLYNPAKVTAERGIADEEIKFDLATSWSNLWDSKYRSMMSIKDSMRDTYSVGVMKVFEEEIKKLMDTSHCFKVNDMSLPLIDGMYEQAMTSYNPELVNIFNQCDQTTVEKVKDELLNLKEIVFGFEVDSGKDDMVKGLIGMNLAWSGDAVYSMDKAENEAGRYLYYTVPATGGNIWFDSWCVPKTSEGEQKDVAMDFLNYLSDPVVAAANMEEIGYTSFIAGPTVHDLIRLWYDPRSYAMFIYHDATVDDPNNTWEDNDFIYQSYDEEGNPEDHDHVFDEEHEAAYQTGIVLGDGEGEYNAESIGDFDFEEGILNMVGSTFDQAVVEGVNKTWDEYMVAFNEKAEAVNAVIVEHNETYGDSLEEIELLEGWDTRNLTYAFEGSIDDVILDEDGNLLPKYDLDSDDPALNPYIFYTDEIETIEWEVEKEGVKTLETVQVARQFGAQYPDQNVIPKLAVMRDFGPNNEFVLAMWSEVKSNNLPVVGVVLFAIILGTAAAFIISAIFVKKYRHSFQVQRRKETSAELETKAEKSKK